MNRTAILFSILSATILFTGCSTLKDALYEEQTTIEATTVTGATVSVDPSEITTDESGNAYVDVKGDLQKVESIKEVTNVEIKDSVRSVASLTNLIHPMAETGLMIILSGAAGFLGLRNRKAAKDKDWLERVSSAYQEAVEEAEEVGAYGEIADTFREILRNRLTDWGIMDEVDAVIEFLRHKPVS